MRDPFKIDGPTCVSFSGGRTSAYMLWRVLQSNGGLPSDARVVFANTGKEMPETLDFVRDCSEQWGVPITWVEYRPDGLAVVDYASASRNGEPFEALIKKRNFLPNPVARFCTVELKILRVADFMRLQGFDEFDVLVGIRSDEPKRVATIRADPSGGSKGLTRRMPLAEAGVGRRDVATFWAAQPFDLNLPNQGGTNPWGNCDLCFLKHSAIVSSLIAEKPERAVWWARMEGSITNAHVTQGGTFRSDRPSYGQMLAFAEAQQDFLGYADDGIECVGCTD